MLNLTALTKAQATVACHRIGKNIFGADVHTILFSESRLNNSGQIAPQPNQNRCQKAETSHSSKKEKPGCSVDRLIFLTTQVHTN